MAGSGFGDTPEVSLGFRPPPTGFSISRRPCSTSYHAARETEGRTISDALLDIALRQQVKILCRINYT
jgi:hypothetical protein